MPLLSLLWGAGGLTSLGKYLIIGVIGLGVAGWAVNGIVAPYKNEIKVLKQEKQDLVWKSEQKDAQIEAHRKRFEEDQARDEERDAEIQRMLSAPTSQSSSCIMSSEQLLYLRKLAGQ